MIIKKKKTKEIFFPAPEKKRNKTERHTQEK
jgi:hypothetical protein